MIDDYKLDREVTIDEATARPAPGDNLARMKPSNSPMPAPVTEYASRTASSPAKLTPAAPPARSKINGNTYIFMAPRNKTPSGMETHTSSPTLARISLRTLNWRGLLLQNSFVSAPLPQPPALSQ
jgi:hypothetical protein